LKTFLLFSVLLISAAAHSQKPRASQKAESSQKIDSICFHLYTDSLKKGTHNYINVDGKLADGRWMPLTSKELQFTTNAGKFEGNDLVLPADFTPANVTIKAVLKSNPASSKEVTIWIKQKPDDEILPTKDDVLNGSAPRKKRRH